MTKPGGEGGEAIPKSSRNTSDGDPPGESRGFLSTAGKVMALFGGFAYLSGFFIVVSFLSRFGIPMNLEAFRLRYIQVGILYMFFPFFFVCPSAAVIYRYVALGEVKGDRSSGGYAKNLGDSHRHLDLLMMLLTLDLILGLCVIYGFAPTQHVIKHINRILKLVLWTVGTLSATLLVQSVIVQWEKLARMDRTERDEITRKRWLMRLLDCLRVRAVPEEGQADGLLSWVKLLSLAMPIIALVAEFCFFRDFAGHLLTVFWKAPGYGYLLFVLAMAFVSWRAIRRYKAATDSGLRGVVITGAAAVFGALYFFSLLTFSFYVYPFIPSQRGGGDYSYSKKAVVYLTPQAAGTLPSCIEAGKKQTIPVVILEETAQAVFVANPTKNGGPANWRKEPNPKIAVVEILRSEIAAIQHQLPEESKTSKHGNDHRTPGRRAD